MYESATRPTRSILTNQNSRKGFTSEYDTKINQFIAIS
jgi:hypothetical protein